MEMAGGAEKILVTGSAGLLGMELCRQLCMQGKAVTAVFHRKPPAPMKGLKVVQCDILDVSSLGEVMDGVDLLYHCAGKVSFDPGSDQQLYKINVEGTANVVNAALDAGVKKMLHVSSVAALGRLRETVLVNENMQWAPDDNNSRYGESKYLGEMEVWRGIAEGLDAIIVNPSIILGAGDWNDGSTALFKSVYNEFPWYTEGVTGFVDVTDVAKAMIMLMESEVSAERFILSAANVTYKELFDKIADAFQKKRPLKKVTAFMASVVWRLEAIKSTFNHKTPLVTRETAVTAFAKIHYDNNKLKIFFPSFEYQSLDHTIKSTCAVLQQKLNNH